jgi:hypothetical protein
LLRVSARGYSVIKELVGIAFLLSKSADAKVAISSKGGDFLSTQAKIHCFNCDSVYYVYWSGINRETVISCPHCDAEITEQMWQRIVDAMGTVHDVNYHFQKYHDEYGEDLFEVSIENVHVPLGKFRKLYE